MADGSSPSALSHPIRIRPRSPAVARDPAAARRRQRGAPAAVPDIADPGVRPLPASFSATTAARNATETKRRLARAAWNEVLAEYGEARLASVGIYNFDHVWRSAICYRFRTSANDPQIANLVRNAVRSYVAAKFIAAPSHPVAVPAATPAQAQPLPPIRPPPPPGPAPAPPPPPPPAADAPLTAQMFPPGVLPDSATPEEIERLFASRGLGESGPVCPVCLESRSNQVRFSWLCDHEMCPSCAESWIKVNTVASGARCPGCMSGTHNRSVADPRVLFGEGGMRLRYDRAIFASFQLPHLALEIARVQAEQRPPASSSSSSDSNPVISVMAKCPECMTVAGTGPTEQILHRCMNPRCAAVYCVCCDSVLGAPSPAIVAKHVSRSCAGSVAETRNIASGPGLTPCGRCGTPLFHAKRHGCHHVTCPTCRHEQCHACGRPHKHPDCKCPIFCSPGFVCRCADSCPECLTTRCVHCDGSCAHCRERAVAHLRNIQQLH